MASLLPNSTNPRDDDDFEPMSSPPESDEEIEGQEVGTAIPNARNEEQSWSGPNGWRIYFPGTNETDDDCKGRAEVIRRLREVFISDERWKQLIFPEHNCVSITLDYFKLTQPDSPRSLRSIAKTIQNEPELSLNSIGLAACRAIEYLSQQNVRNYLLSSIQHGLRIQPRILNFQPIISSLRTLKSNLIGKFISIKGTVIRVSNIRQQLIGMNFRCNKCNEVQALNFIDYKYNIPTSCGTDKCRSRSFTPLKNTARTIDWQRIRIQEQQNYRYTTNNQSSDESNTNAPSDEEGRIPRTIDAEMFADLIDSCVPGDVATVSGILKIMTINEMMQGYGNKQKDQAMYYMYIEANSISTMRSRAGLMMSEENTPAVNAVHTVIHEVVREDDPFGFLVHSAVPSIYGHELVKAGLILALFGGSEKLKRKNKPTMMNRTDEEDDGREGNNDNDKNDSSKPNASKNAKSFNDNKISIRRDAHVLIVGDPGLGKSQMLKAFCNLAPRGVYVSANTASTTGLTVTVVRETGGDFALEAGALVLSDGGICCIDEFDKMRCDHGTLLEAMEQQSVSVAKAGLLCNLSARTTVLAAANPMGGQYNNAKTVCENLKLAKPLLSRFDLIFILLDKPDVKKDRFISKHVMRSFARNHNNPRKRRRSQNNYNNFGDSQDNWRRNKRNALINNTVNNTGNNNNNSSGNNNAIAAARSAIAGTQAQALARDRRNDKNEIINVDNEEECEGDSLEERLENMRIKDPLPPSLFREYVLYARTHVHPALSSGAKKVLQKHYITLRKRAKEEAIDTTPITTRQLESMIRLSEARARSVMRTIVTASDARDVVEIMKKCMDTELTDGDTGVIDFGRASGMSKSSEAKRFVKALHAESKRRGGDHVYFTDSEMKKIALDIGINITRYSTVLDSVNTQGYIIKKGPGKWKVSSI